MNGTTSPRGSSLPRVIGVLVTFRRPQVLRTMLEALTLQDRALDLLYVVDNAPSEESERVVREHADPRTEVRYLPSATNLGSIGGFGLGMRHAALEGEPDDWVLSLDDDDPPFRSDLFRELARFAKTTLHADPCAGGVGVVGARFDAASARSVRLDDQELTGAVPVDWLGQGHFAMYRVGAVRTTGEYHDQLFFGHGELEYGLRMRAAGFGLYAHGELWHARREEQGRLDLELRPSLALDAPSWRRYYRLRNLIWILRENGHTVAAARVIAVRGVAKPLAGLGRDRHLAMSHLSMNARAAFDGWTGRLGPRQQPEIRLGPKPRA
jgi:GT2 family glycosyltransferase